MSLLLWYLRPQCIKCIKVTYWPIFFVGTDLMVEFLFDQIFSWKRTLKCISVMNLELNTQLIECMLLYVLYDNDLRIDYQYSLQRTFSTRIFETKAFTLYSLDTLSFIRLKRAGTSLLIKTPGLSKPELPSLGVLNTFVNTFQFNLVLI